MPKPGLAYRAALDPPSLTPSAAQDQSQMTQAPEQVSEAGARTVHLPLAPGEWQEHRILEANRAAASANFTPGSHNASADAQKGGSPGGGANTSYTTNNVITSQDPKGATSINGVPPSARKLAYGWSDYSNAYPTFVGAHLQIQWNANPNKPQLNPTPFNTEGPQQNTRYSTPSPFAAGTFIG